MKLKNFNIPPTFLSLRQNTLNYLKNLSGGALG
jgi:hypothetical protein